LDIAWRKPDQKCRYVWAGDPPRPRKVRTDGRTDPATTRVVFYTCRLVPWYLGEVDEGVADNPQENLEKAERCVIRARACVDRYDPDDVTDRGDVMAALLRVCTHPAYKQFDPAQTLRNIQELQQLRAAKGDVWFDVVQSIDGLLGMAYMALGRDDEALQHLEHRCLTPGRSRTPMTS